MKTKDRDPQSYFAIIESFLRQADLDEQEFSLLTTELKRYLTIKLERDSYFVHPAITKFCTDWYREFYRLIGFKDPYKKLKDLSNAEAKSILPTLNIQSFEDAIKSSLKGNKLDFGAVLVLNPDLDKLKEEFQDLNSTEITIDDSEKLKQDIEEAQTVLFLPDNAGEILFDIPFLEHLNKHFPRVNIFIGAKDSPMLNDVTYEELKELGIDKYGKLVSIGSNCFGLHEEDVSRDFKRILFDVDLVIAKGQAYLEFFTEYDFTKVYNLTRVKYPVVNEAFGTLQPHQNVVMSSKRYCHTGKPYDFKALHPKIVERDELRQLSEKLNAEGKKIVTINGAFDILHYGHVLILEDAKRQGDILIVGLNSDASIKQYKSKFRPIIPQEERAQMMASLGCVDYVFIFDETEPMPFLEELRPHVHCNGKGYDEECIEAPTVRKHNGQIHINPFVYGHTTKVIEKVMDTELKRKAEQQIADLKKEEPQLKTHILDTLEKQKGIIFAQPAIVHRAQYSGRDILAKNSKFESGYVDERGYVPVEWWIMSNTQAENAKMKSGEGFSNLILESGFVNLKEALNFAERNLFGSYKNKWPLTKILDIGGEPIKPSFSEELEVPPIPAHIHNGYIVDGKVSKPGKLEAYFFPPVSVYPYNQDFGKIITRLGLKQGTTREQFEELLKEFGQSDAMYDLLQPYDVNAYDCWTIPAGTVHAPGPWTTFEIQLPQDDYNLAAWQLGKRVEGEELEKTKEEQLTRGLKNEQDFTDNVVDWNVSLDLDFKNKYYNSAKIIESGPWGRRLQIFFNKFYGEAFEILPGKSFRRNSDERPFACIVWSGNGTANDNPLNCEDNNQKEFLVTPNAELEIKNNGEKPLLIYSVFPIN